MNKEYREIIEEIIEEQRNIVGDKIAQNRVEATKVIKIHNNTIEILSDPKQALKKLIESFEEIFGEASTEVCEEVIKRHKIINTKK
jgi:DNA phosphorothioation-dependent restriction protein DptG